MGNGVVPAPAGGQFYAERPARWRLMSVLALGVLLIGAFGYMTLVLPRQWRTYTDPSAGFSFEYLPGWLLTTDANGSHPTLINPATGATINAYVVTLPGSPQTVLDNTVPASATEVVQRRLAGALAIDFVLAGAVSGGGDTDPGTLLGIHLVMIAAANSAGSTNEYVLALTQPPARSASSDELTFEQLVATFSLRPSTSWLPFLARSGTPQPITTSSTKDCDAICWADSNWNVNDFSADTSGQDCGGYDDNAGQYINCSAHALAILGDFQPDYQCSEFVSRALAQDGLLPGLASGGYDSPGGPGSGTGQFGNLSYNIYPFTATDAATGGDTLYNLLGVGTPGAAGLYDYLVDSGIGINLHQDLAQAAPGDVVFFYTPAISDANREHVMLITSLVHYSNTNEGLGGWDALVDGHNRAAYHNLLSTVVGATYHFEIVHLVAERGTRSAFATGGSGWATGTDNNGQQIAYVSTTSGVTPVATADVRFPPQGACLLSAYIPNVDATAVVSFQVTLANGRAEAVSVDESEVDGWVLLFAWEPPGTGSPPIRVEVGNNTGSDGQSLGLGSIAELCVS